MKILDQKTDVHSETLADVKQLGTWSAIASLGYVFWLVGGMEMIERLAYFGVKSVRVLYANDPVSSGGLGVNLTEFGVILSVWAFVMSFTPVIFGGLADRIGYKETIALSTTMKVGAYLIMWMFASYWGFFAGAILLALGTGIFKPGIQGTLVKTTNRMNSSVAWGLFYQIINIGGFLGPLFAAHVRQLDWPTLFISCAIVISLNFLLLLTYKEPGRRARLEEKRKDKAENAVPQSLWREACTELSKPELMAYLALFSGFWFMFLSLFDVLPIYISEWVDTSVIVGSLFGNDGASSPIVIFLFGMNKTGNSIQPEGLVNLNSAMIMLTCFLIAGFSARLRAIDSMTIGTLLCTASLVLIGLHTWAWLCIAGLMIFSTGEMLSSPKFLEFLGNIAPASKKAMYLGFSGLPQGIGWTLESYLGPHWYDLWASKERFSREMLLEYGLDPAFIKSIPNGDAFTNLLEVTGKTPRLMTQLLYDSHHSVGKVWFVLASVGVLSATGMFFYGRWIARRLLRKNKLLLNNGWEKGGIDVA